MKSFINDLARLKIHSTLLSLSYVYTTENNQTYSLSSIYEYVSPSYSLEKIIGLIPIGARASGSTTIYNVIYDGTHLRTNCPANSTIYFYIAHTE